METVIPFIYSPLMIRILALLLFILPQFGYANLSCINLFNESDFRIELRNNDITLTPLNKSYKKNLKELYENEDVARFFLGGEPSVDAVKNHIQRAQKKSGGSPEVFDGQWVIKKDGEIVGFQINV